MDMTCCTILAHELPRSHKHDMCVCVCVCVCLTHCISHAYKACRRASSSHCSAVQVLASSVTRMLMNCSSALVCATPAPVVGMRLPMILYTFKQTQTFDKDHRFVKNGLLPICVMFLSKSYSDPMVSCGAPTQAAGPAG